MGILEKFFLKKYKQNNTTTDSDFYREYNFKRNVFIATATIFIIFVSFFLYVLFVNDVISFEEEVEQQPLRIVIPYPNSSINIDDYETKKYEVRAGDTLQSILIKEFGVTPGDVNAIIVALKKVYNLSKLKVGQILDIKIRVVINQGKNGEIEDKTILDGLRLNVDSETEVSVSMENDNYVAIRSQLALNTHILKYEVKIKDNLFVDGTNAGIPASIMFEFIKIFSYDIDFQRDLRKGDVFEVVFEGFFNDEGEKVRDGNVLYASLDNNGKIYDMYRFNNNYYSKTGQSVQKSLLKTPINGARISSSFGYRRHPILGYSKKHEGIDFAAPTGTPFFAAGAGTIVKAGWGGSFGNYVRIRHVNGYETEYAHASRIATSIKAGTKVRQGQVIAYVGTTGMSTGPHLHYGTLYNGARINPTRIKTLPTTKLIGKNMVDFDREVERINIMRKSIPNQSIKK